MSSMESIYDASNGDEKVGVGKVPEVVFNDDGRGIRINRGDCSIENGFKVGRHIVVVQFRGA
jgi:hypothetical protein